MCFTCVVRGSVISVVMVTGASTVVITGIVLSSCGPGVVCAGSMLVHTVVSIILIGIVVVIGDD